MDPNIKIMRISLIIPSLNAVTLSRALAAVAEQSRLPDEVIVVGRDEKGILTDFPQVRFVDTGEPVCAAAARNRGIEATKSDVVAFLDADCIPDRNWLQQHEKYQVLGEKVVGGSVGLAGSNYWAQSDNISMFHDFVPALPASCRRLLPTLNLSVHRSVIEEIGGLDESFPGAAAEDADWTIRMHRAGFKLRFEPSALVIHAPARTTWADVVSHWHNLGHNAIRVRLRYPREFNTPRFAQNSLCLRLLAPLIAVSITATIYKNPHFWRYWASLPIVYTTKIIYCLGAAKSVDSGFALQE